MKTLLSERFFRPGSEVQSRKANFILSNGGIGDYIGYMSAIVWIAKNHPQIYGRLFCMPWFMPLAKNFLKNFPTWEVLHRKELTEADIKTKPTFAPYHQPISRIGADCVTLGYIYYLNMTPPPEDGQWYEKLDLSEVKLPEGLPEKYVVMTPGASYLPRTMRAHTFNGIKDYLVEKGYTPVFLGNKNFRDVPVNIEADYDFSGGIDLVGKTSLLEAAKVMANAKLVLGIDNGLLHLAGTTDVPLLIGYTICSPQHSQPRRATGIILNIHADPKELSCLFCQGQMRMMFNHDFKDCLYKDNACTNMSSQSWIGAIEKILFPAP